MVGALLLSMVVIDSLLKRLPISAAMIYLVLGYVLGPDVTGILELDPLAHAASIAQVAEIAVLISLFAAGLNLGVPLTSRKWLLPVRLALPSMVLTIAMVAAASMYLMDLSLGEAILLGALLAPTDPVLAAGIAPDGGRSPELTRFGLSGEGALNDGTAFPFVLLGLGFLGMHALGSAGLHWWTVDLLWSMLGGLLIGFASGVATRTLTLAVQHRLHQAPDLDQFVAVGLVAIAYGAATICHASGFLAVFAAGCALRRGKGVPVEEILAQPAASARIASETTTVAPDGRSGTARPDQAVQNFNGQIEKLAELTMVVLIGAMLPYAQFMSQLVWFLPLLFFVIRPAAIWVGTVGASLSVAQRAMMGWFGIRGIGSVFYLAFALHRGVDGELAQTLISLTLWTVAVSIVLHGITVLPFMKRRAPHARARVS
ncbi:sodium:proton antiporter [Niveibacterium sp. SC-1]|uniref:cation:proton antiporter n=1 Tax=Niveibacterium sp. SC-1 TaxID=3135646 RepID=UPI00311E51BA